MDRSVRNQMWHNAPMSLRVAQITDCHFTARPGQLMYGIDVDATFAKVLQLLKQWQPDRLLISGDLSELGDPASYRRLREALQDLDLPINAIPGNHDLRHNLQQYFVGNQDHLHTHIETAHWDLILLDSLLAGHAEGHLGDDQMAWLGACLQRSGDRPKIVFVHHHPLPIGDQWLDCMGLTNADALWTVLANAEGVKALVCGHIHQLVETQHQGIRMLSTPSTCSQARPGQSQFVNDELGPGFRWFELEANGNYQTGVIRTVESAMAISKLALHRANFDGVLPG